MKCPVCKEVDLVMSDRQGVEIDYCPRCRGVWLDRGELDKIIERSERIQQTPPPQASPQPAPPPQAPYHGGGYYEKPYKRKSIWRELFD